MQEHLAEFEARRVRIVAVSVDSPAVTRDHSAKQGYTFTFLSDQEMEVIPRYDLVHAGGGPRQADIARPAEFLIDSTGTIRWVNLTDDYRVRARPQELLRILDELHGRTRHRQSPFRATRPSLSRAQLFLAYESA